MTEDRKSKEQTASELKDEDLDDVQGGARLSQTSITRTTGANLDTPISKIGGNVSPGDVSYYGYYGDSAKDLGIKTNLSSFKKR